MASDKDITSTKRLLNVIRKGADAGSGAGADVSRLLAKQPARVAFKGGDVVGIDFDESTIRMVKASAAGGQWRITQIKSVPAEVDLDKPEFVEVLRRHLQAFCGTSAKTTVWAAIPAERTEIWNIRVPKVARKNQANAIYFTAKKERTFDEREVVFDYEVLGEIADRGVPKLSVNAYTASLDDVNRLRGAFAKAGFPLHGITTTSFAVQNFFRTGWIEPTTETYAHLAIGNDWTRIDLYSEDRMILSRGIKTGLASMIEALVDGYNERMAAGSAPDVLLVPEISMEPDPFSSPGEALDDQFVLEAEGESASGEIDAPTARAMLIARFGMPVPEGSTLPGQDIDDAEFFAMIRPALERLLRQVERTFDHFTNVLSLPPVGRVYASGLPTAFPPLLAFLGEQLAIGNHSLDPLDPETPGLALGPELPGPAERTAYTNAAGLALSANEHTPNLLFTFVAKEKQRTEQTVNKVVAAACFAAVLLAGGLYTVQMLAVGEKKAEVARLEQQLATMAPLVSQEEIVKLSAEFKSTQETLKGFGQRFLPVAAVSELTGLVPDNVRLLNVRVEGNTAPQAKQPQPGTAPAGDERILVVDGIVIGEPSLFETNFSSFLYKLRSSPLFGNPTIFKSGGEQFGPEGEVLRFVINIKLNLA